MAEFWSEPTPPTTEMTEEIVTTLKKKQKRMHELRKSQTQKSSEKKLSSAKLLEINETTAASIITLSYDSLRELLEALAIKNGYKIYNHECYVAFLNSIIGKKDLAKSFDSLRKLRNSINYYGQEISVNDTKTVFEDIANLIKKCKSLISEIDSK